MDGRLTGRILRMLSEGFRKLTLKQVEDPGHATGTRSGHSTCC